MAVEALSAGDPARIGAYRLLGRLGTGGMGRVYLAELASGRRVAVKVVHTHLVEMDDTFRERFRHEVDAAKAVGGFWTAAVVDADADADAPWFASEYIPARSLEDTVGRDGTLGVAALRRLGLGLAEALAAIHRVGLVHRDLKPSNGLMADGGPRVIDFGIARALEGSSPFTATGAVIGTPGYWAPEQATGDRVSAATDVFALGAVLVFAATGRGPFGTGRVEALFYRTVHADPDLNGVPQALRALLRRCLDKTPSKRPSVRALLTELGELRAGSRASSAAEAGRPSAGVAAPAPRRDARKVASASPPSEKKPGRAPAKPAASPAVKPKPPAAGPPVPPAEPARPRTSAADRRRATPQSPRKATPASGRPADAGVRRRRLLVLATALLAAAALVAGVLLWNGPGPGGSTAPATVALAAGLTEIAVSPDGSRVFVANVREDTVSVVDPDAATVLATVRVPGAEQLAVTPDGREVWVANFQGESITVLDGRSGAVTGSVTDCCKTSGVTFSPDGRTAYLTHGSFTTVSVVDVTRRAVVASVPAGKAPLRLALRPDGKRGYLTFNQTDEEPLGVLDTGSNSVLARLPIPGGSFKVAAAPDGRHVYVGTRSGTVVVVDTSTDTVTGTIPVGRRDVDVAAAPDGRTLYATAGESGEVVGIDTATNTVTRRLGTVDSASGLAISPDGDRLYVPGFWSGRLSVLDVT